MLSQLDLALLDPCRTFGRAALAQLVVEQCTLAVELAKAFAPIGHDAVDACRHGELLGTCCLRSLRLSLDGRPIARNALALRGGVVIGREDRHTRHRHGL